MESRINKFCLMMISLLFIAACQSGNEEDPPGTSPIDSSEKNPPTISGSPLTSILENTAYSFMPDANDIDGDSLVFSIVNQPAWTDFDSATGMLSGTPTSSDIGITFGIVISVSDGENVTSLAAFDLAVITVNAGTGSALLTWAAPETYTNTNQITDLQGYEIHYGTSSGVYDTIVVLDDPLLTEFTINNLNPGTYFFVMRAVTSTANSAFTPERTKTIQVNYRK